MKGRCLNHLTNGPCNGSEGRTRTCDLPVNSRMLYQLSYFGIILRLLRHHLVDFYYYRYQLAIRQYFFIIFFNKKISSYIYQFKIQKTVRVFSPYKLKLNASFTLRFTIYKLNFPLTNTTAIFTNIHLSSSFIALPAVLTTIIMNNRFLLNRRRGFNTRTKSRCAYTL